MEKRLHCYGGDPAPEPVLEGWGRYLELPGEAQLGIWKIVVDSLAHPEHDNAEERIQTLSGLFELEPEDVVEAALAAQFLLANSCAAGLDSSLFRADLVTLSGEAHEAIEVIASRYETIRSELRGIELFRTLTAHGKVLKNVTWRMDKVVSSDRGLHSDAEIIFLTLEYQEGEETSSITLQLAREGLANLKQFMKRFDD